jgi:O-antigen/teichoic acid export membrane protein
MLQRILYSFFSKGIVALINFLILLLSARYLGIRTRGEISVFLINIALVQVITEVYTGYSLIHFLQKFNLRKVLLHGTLLALLTAGMASALLPMRHHFSFNGWLYFPVLLLVLLHSFMCVILLGKQRLRTYNLIALLQPTLLLLLLLLQLFFQKEFTFFAYYFSLLFSFALALPVSAFLVLRSERNVSTFNEYNFISVLNNGFFFQAGTLMLLFINRYNYYVLAETEKIGLYSTACALMDALLLVAAAASPVLLSRFSALSNSSALVLRILRLSLLLVTALYMLCWLIPEDFILMLVGKGYAGIRQVMVTYGPSVVFQTACILFGNYYAAKGQQAQLVRLYLMPFLVHLFLAPLLIGWIGISGAALASGLTFSFVFFRIYLHFCKSEGISPLRFFKNFSLLKEIKALMHDH